MAAKKIYVDLDLNKQKITGYLSNPQTTAARTGLSLVAGDAGYAVYDTTDLKDYRWSGAAWVAALTTVPDRNTISTLTFAAAQTWATATSENAVVTLTANLTSLTITGAIAGHCYTLMLVQDGTGSRTAAFGSGFKWPGGTAPVLSTTANARDIAVFYYDGTNYNGILNKAFG